MRSQAVDTYQLVKEGRLEVNALGCDRVDYEGLVGRCVAHDYLLRRWNACRPEKFESHVIRSKPLSASGAVANACSGL
jgi:hypothetical protein